LIRKHGAGRRVETNTESGGVQEASSQGSMGVYPILPSQYLDLTGASGGLSGEQRLMAALLADAINVFRKGVLSRSVRTRLLYIDAERWMAARGSIRHGLTFQTVCDALGLDGVLVRRKMIEWKHSVLRQSGGAAPRLRLKLTPRQQSVSAGRSRGSRSQRRRRA